MSSACWACCLAAKAFCTSGPTRRVGAAYTPHTCVSTHVCKFKLTVSWPAGHNPGLRLLVHVGVGVSAYTTCNGASYCLRLGMVLGWPKLLAGQEGAAYGHRTHSSLWVCKKRSGHSRVCMLTCLTAALRNCYQDCMENLSMLVPKTEQACHWIVTVYRQACEQ